MYSKTPTELHNSIQNYKDIIRTIHSYKTNKEKNNNIKPIYYLLCSESNIKSHKENSKYIIFITILGIFIHIDCIFVRFNL